MSDVSVSLARSSAVMATGTIASRVLGVVRAALQTLVVGAAILSSDAWDVANTLPNLIYLLLAGGVLNAVLVPQLTRAARHPDGGEDYVNRLLTLSLAAMGMLTLLGTLGAGVLVRVYAANMPPAALNLSAAFALLCMPQVFFYGVYTLLGQVLNAQGRFAAYMWSPVLANVVAIAGLVVFLLRYPRRAPVEAWSPGMVWLLAGSATAGVAAQALVLVIPLRRAGFRYHLRWGFRGVGLRTASTVAMWTFAALAVSQLGFVVTSNVLTRAVSIGAATGVHAPGKYSYSQAFLLFMLPHSLVTVSLVTALFTRMSHAAARRDLAEVRRDVGRGLGLTAVAIVPATFGAFALGAVATRVLFPGTPIADTNGIAAVFMAMSAGLVPFGALYLLQRVYYAFEDARTPFLLQIAVTAVATAGNLVSATLPVDRMAIGVGVSQSVSNLLGAGLGFVLLRRGIGALRLAPVVRSFVRLGLAALAADVLTVLLLRLAFHPERGFAAALLALAVGGSVFVAVYLAMARGMRVREVDEALAPLLGRVRRLRSGRPRPS